MIHEILLFRFNSLQLLVSHTSTVPRQPARPPAQRAKHRKWINTENKEIRRIYKRKQKMSRPLGPPQPLWSQPFKLRACLLNPCAGQWRMITFLGSRLLNMFVWNFSHWTLILFGIRRDSRAAAVDGNMLELTIIFYLRQTDMSCKVRFILIFSIMNETDAQIDGVIYHFVSHISNLNLNMVCLKYNGNERAQ